MSNRYDEAFITKTAALIGLQYSSELAIEKCEIFIPNFIVKQFHPRGFLILTSMISRG